jgi:FkbM family methyltransferase
MQPSHFKLLLKDFLKKLFLFLGLKVTRRNSGIFAYKNNFNYQFSPANEDKFKWLQNMNINTVIDVGAHQGEFAAQIHQVLPNAKLYSFEPLRENFNELNSNLKNLPNFKSFKLAVGAHQGQMEMYCNNFSQSSSILKTSQLHKENFPFSAVDKLEKIEINTLDDIVKSMELEDNILLKIDVQGYEDQVIMGAKNCLNSIQVIIIETSFAPLYEGQPLFADIYQMLIEHGFVYSGSLEELKSPVDGIPLQQDSLFIKK